MKVLLKLIALLIVLVVIGAVVVLFYIDAIARKGIESAGTYALGVETSLDRADVGVLSGEFAMEGLTVANPQGFSTPHFLSLGHGGVAVTLGTLREEVVVLRHLVFADLDMNLQRTKDGANYKVIADNLKRFESGQSTEEKPKSGKRFIIDKLEIRNVVVHVDALPDGGEAARVTIPIEKIEMAGIGSDTGKGVLLAELANIIIQVILDTVVRENGNLLPGTMAGELQGNLAQLKSLKSMDIDVQTQVQEQLGKQGVPEGLSGEAGKAAEEVMKGIGGLFGGEKKK